MRARKQYCSQSDGSGGTTKTETSALWVCMLTVFASAFVLYNKESDKVSYDKMNPSLTRLNSGFAHAALRILTGANALYASCGAGWYASIEAKQTSGYPMVLSSKTAAELQQLFPGSGAAQLNHTTVKGIVGGHAYAVWDVGKRQFGTPGPNNPQVDAIRILNPWGKYKQEYTAVPTATSQSYSWQTIDVAGQGDFWIPAGVVPKFFSGFYYAEKALGNAVA